MVEYKPIIGFENYSIGSDGSVKNKHNRIRKQTIIKNNPCITLLKDKVYTTFVVSKLVATHFLEPSEDPNKTVVYHLDGNRLNNNYDNLAWATRSDIIKLAYARGSYDDAKEIRADKIRQSLSKEVHKYSLEGRYLASYPSTKEAEAQTNVAQTSISKVARGINKQAGGYIWSYERRKKCYQKTKK